MNLRIFELKRTEVYRELESESVFEENDVIPVEYVVRDMDDEDGHGEDLDIFMTLDEAKKFIEKSESESVATPRKELLKTLDESWDAFVEKFEEVMGKNYWTESYWTAYKFMKNFDVDGGICFEYRSRAIEKLLKIVEESCYTSRNPKNFQK